MDCVGRWPKFKVFLGYAGKILMDSQKTAALAGFVYLSRFGNVVTPTITINIWTNGLFYPCFLHTCSPFAFIRGRRTRLIPRLKKKSILTVHSTHFQTWHVTKKHNLSPFKWTSGNSFIEPPRHFLSSLVHHYLLLKINHITRNRIFVHI